MNFNSINIRELVEQTKAQLQEGKTLTPALKMSIELILLVAPYLPFSAHFLVFIFESLFTASCGK